MSIMESIGMKKPRPRRSLTPTLITAVLDELLRPAADP
jgi:hypothetical protein